MYKECFYPSKYFNNKFVKPEVVAGGTYSLLGDKYSGVIARMPNRTPIYAISGGCTNSDYCPKADINLRRAIENITFGPYTERMDTMHKQQIYQNMLDIGYAILVPINGKLHAKEGDNWFGNVQYI